MIWPIPPFDPQSLNGIDIDDCVGESLCHIVYGLTGIRYSPRALASLMYAKGKLDSNGSSTDDALAFANTYGLVPYANWPTPATFTHDSYLVPVPPEVLATAHFYTLKKIDPNLAKSPLWTQLSFPHPTGSVLHWVDQFTETEYMDSEPGGVIKPLTYGGAVILSQHSIQLTYKNMEFVQITDTEFGLEFTSQFVTTIVRFTSPEDAKEKLKGIPNALKADGSVDYTKARRINI